MPSLFHCYVQIRDGSLTHTAERLKTTISPFSYPRQTQFLTLSLPLNPKNFSHSKAGLRGPCNSCTVLYRSTCLIWCRNLISTDLVRVFQDQQCVKETKHNLPLWAMHFCRNLTSVKPEKVKSLWKGSCKPCRRLCAISDDAILQASLCFSHSLCFVHTQDIYFNQESTSLYHRRTQVAGDVITDRISPLWAIFNHLITNVGWVCAQRKFMCLWG